MNMPFLFLGIILIATSVYFIRLAKKDGDPDGVLGVTALLIVGIFLVLFYGVYFQLLRN